MSRRVFGSPVKRLEDPALLTGQGRFIDDIRLPGTLHAAFVRSPHPHARILGIDTDAASMMPGIHAVLTLADNRIADLSALSRMHRLTQLNLANNRVTDISVLGGLDPFLRILDLRGNEVTDLSPLGGHSLWELYVSRNRVAELSPLRGGHTTARCGKNRRRSHKTAQ